MNPLPNPVRRGGLPSLRTCVQRRGFPSDGDGRQRRAWVLGRGGGILLAVCLGLPAWAASNIYTEVIVARNVFGLNKPPAPAPPADTNPPLPKLTLVGWANVLGTRKAVLKTEPVPGPGAKQPQRGAPNPEASSLILAEGASEQGVTVLAIDEKAGAVEVDHQGQRLTLTMDKDGPQPPTGPAVAAAGAVVPPAQMAIPRPPGMVIVNQAPGGTPTLGGAVPAIPPVPPTGMSEEMRQRFMQRYGIPMNPTAPPVPTAIPKPVNQ